MISKYSIVSTTVSNKAEAILIASALLDFKLCACVHMFPINSIYRWNGVIENSEEFLLHIKTKKELYSEVEKKILELHSYEIPEILQVDINGGFHRYLNWIDEEVK